MACREMTIQEVEAEMRSWSIYERWWMSGAWVSYTKRKEMKPIDAIRAEMRGLYALARAYEDRIKELGGEP